MNSNLSPVEITKYAMPQSIIDLYPCIPDWAQSQEDYDFFKGNLSSLEEVKGSFPKEDFIESDGIISDIQDIIDACDATGPIGKKALKHNLKLLIEKIENLQSRTFHSSCYGRESIDEVLKLIEE